jgi:hypothetical protein
MVRTMAQLDSRQIVRRCIEFDDPPRIGLHFQVQPVEGKTWDLTDFGFVSYAPDPDAPSIDGKNEWGLKRVSFDPTGANMGQVKEHPLGGGWEALQTYRFPDFANPARYAHLPDAVAEHHARGKYVYADIPALMTLPGDLRGLENWFMDHAVCPEDLGRLLDMIVAARLQIIDAYAAAGVDGAIAWDDMGTH